MPITITPAALAAGHTRALAAILRNQDSGDAAALLGAIAVRLDLAADAFAAADADPIHFDGVAVTNCIPADAALALLDAMDLAESDTRTAHIAKAVKFIIRLFR